MIRIWFAAGQGHWPDYAPHLPEALAEAGLRAEIVHEAPDPLAVDYIVFAPGGDVRDFTPYRRVKAVLNLWAGVERIVGNPTLTQPLCRMVDPGMTEGMVEWVTGQVLRHHLDLDRWIRGAPGWDQRAAPLARERTVAMLGLGELGSACARALERLNFRVLGWSRSPKTLEGIATFHGDEGLERVLRAAQMVVTLVPATPETTNLLDARRLGWLPRGAVVLNPGRGVLIDDAALLAALGSGHLGHATLDVFRVEPLPEDHPFRSHPKVTITPHIAAFTRPMTAARVIAENIRRGEAGEPFLHLVDRTRGY